MKQTILIAKVEAHDSHIPRERREKQSEVLLLKFNRTSSTAKKSTMAGTRKFVIGAVQEVVEEEDKEDIEIVFAPGVNSSVVSDNSLNIIREIAKASNNKRIYITSTIRTPREQAEIMYRYIELEGVDIQKALYAEAGGKVVDVYVDGKAVNHSKNDIIDAMEKKINELGPTSVSKHCGNAETIQKINVFDISSSRLSNPQDFLLEAQKNNNISKIINEYQRNCYHIEIIQ